MKKKRIRISAIILTIVIMLISLSACGSTDPVVKKKESKTYLTELPVVTDGVYPESFDLRDYGYVTPVKSQNPFGYCWAFASIAAAETSILSELHKNCDEYPLDLSEHHLAWFTKSHIPARGEDGYDSSDSQSGEGYYTTAFTSNSWNEGGYALYSIVAFSAGIGAASEETAPYKGKNGTITYIDYSGQLSDSASIFGSTKYYYSANDDWSLSDDLRFSRLYDLEAGWRLPEIAADGDTLNTTGINAVKQALIEGRGIAISFASDSAMSNESSRYINTETWAHYTYEAAFQNHCVEIVGWDDNYSRDNFKSDKAVQWDENSEALTDADGNYVYEEQDTPLPAGDGAWIVKNSWGADTEDFPNYGEWGIDNSGYFYISYYDQSLYGPIAFDFDTEHEGGTYDITQQYDYMITTGMEANQEQEEVREANVFEAPEDMDLEAVGAYCAADNTTVTYDIYLLSSDSDDPESGTKAASFSRTYSYSGYYRESLDTPVVLEKGQKYSVVVTQLQSSTNTYYYQFTQNLTGSSSVISMFSNEYYVGVINSGESYIYFKNSGWSDLTEFLKTENGEDADMVADDNFSIKAFGNIT